MTKWKHTLRIKDLLSPDNSDENAVAVGKLAAERTRAMANAHKGACFFDDLDEIADHFDDTEGLDDFNSTLSELYDIADAHRIWIA